MLYVWIWEWMVVVYVYVSLQGDGKWMDDFERLVCRCIQKCKWRLNCVKTKPGINTTHKHHWLFWIWSLCLEMDLHTVQRQWSDQKVQQPGSVIGCVSAHGHLHLVETTFMQKGPKFYSMSFLISSKPNSAPVTPLCNKGGVIAISEALWSLTVFPLPVPSLIYCTVHPCAFPLWKVTGATFSVLTPLGFHKKKHRSK